MEKAGEGHRPLPFLFLPVRAKGPQGDPLTAAADRAKGPVWKWREKTSHLREALLMDWYPLFNSLRIAAIAPLR